MSVVDEEIEDSLISPEDSFSELPRHSPKRLSGGVTVLLVLFCGLVALLHLQFLTAEGVETSNEPSQVRLYHVYSLILMPCALLAIPQLIRSVPITLFFAVAILSQLVAGLRFGWNVRVAQFAFAAYIFLVTVYATSKLGSELVRGIFRSSFVVAHIMVALKLVGYWVILGGIPRTAGDRPDIIFLYAGGNNLETTWLGLSLCMFLKSPWFYLFAGNCLLTSAIYHSRSGVVITMIFVIYRLVGQRLTVARMFEGAAVGFVALVAIFFSSPDVAIIERFTMIGDERDYGSTSRRDLWETTISVISENPLGYGAGGGFEEVNNQTSRVMPENNVHNIYLQIALDSGVQTLLAYLLLMSMIIKNFRAEPLCLFVAVYLIAGMAEFTSYESMFWIVIGFLVVAQQERSSQGYYLQYQPDKLASWRALE